MATGSGTMQVLLSSDKFSIVDEPEENESGLASANTYYSSPSTRNKFTLTKISSQIPTLLYLEIDNDLEWNTNSVETMLLSESVLQRIWDTPEEDEAWADL